MTVAWLPSRTRLACPSLMKCGCTSGQRGFQVSRAAPTGASIISLSLSSSAGWPGIGVGDAHRRAQDPAFVERGVPRGLQPLRGGEHAAKRRPDVLTENIGDAEMLFTVMKRQANGLNKCRHYWPGRPV